MQREHVKKLREDRASILEDAAQILGSPEGEGGDLSAEQEARFDELHGEADKILAKVERFERQDDAETRARESQDEAVSEVRDLDERGEVRDALEPEMMEAAANKAFRDWVIGNDASNGIGVKQTRDLQIMPKFMRQGERRAETDPQSTTTLEGGDFIPREFSNSLMEALLSFGGMRQARTTVIETAGGGTLDWPTVDDTDQKGALLAENAADSVQIMDTGIKTLDAYKYTSKIVKVSLELMQDSAFDMNALVMRKLGDRIGRITNQHFTTGTGSSQPNGAVTASAAGTTVALSTAITYLELVDLEHSVDPAYRPEAEWMFADSVLKAFKKLVDDQSRPLWLPGVAIKEPDTILGYNYIINQDMAGMEASAKSVLFGDFSTYLIRDVLGIRFMRLVERYADNLQVGFIAFSRHDGELIDAGTNPIKHILHPSP